MSFILRSKEGEYHLPLKQSLKTTLSKVTQFPHDIRTTPQNQNRASQENNRISTVLRIYTWLPI
ncbi:hypothetical protein DL95DRAFT_395835 [Leptodontidium sp. 2 PMI_412]|nr:hypothetical protein DL95DRAFT_395835 [Leptodontidium sp. 2 PMI_412]